MKELRKQWLEAFRSIDVPAIGKDTAARIMAVMYVFGNNEAFVYNNKFIDEIHHIQEVYKVSGGEMPDREMCSLMRGYIKELEDYEKEHKNDESEAVFVSRAPEWVHKLFNERYNIKIIN